MKEPVLKTAGGGGKDSSGGVVGAGGEEQSKKTATSLILFEEVDVIFDEDAGFLSAIKTFMSTTKRPVILTTSGQSAVRLLRRFRPRSPPRAFRHNNHLNI